VCAAAVFRLRPGQNAGEQADTGGEEAQHFDISEFQLTRNTVLEVGDIERAVYPMPGPGRSIDDVIVAQEALETL
jgi:hypothetical protein